MTTVTPADGWPVHREWCKAGDTAVQATVTSVKGYGWLIRRCGGCGQVALSRAPSAPAGGDAA